MTLLLCFLLFAALGDALLKRAAPVCNADPVAADFATGTCVSDFGGVDDQPNQKDLTQFCRLPATDSTQVKFAFSFDDTDFKSQLGYGCILISNNGGSKPSYAVCVSVTGRNARQVNTELFKCGPSGFTERCIVEQSYSGFKTCCTSASIRIDPFGEHNTSLTEKGLDFGVVCNIAVDEVGTAAANPTLLNACSYASGSGSSPGDCIRSEAQCTTANAATVCPPLLGTQLTQCKQATCVGGFCEATNNVGADCSIAPTGGPCNAQDKCDATGTCQNMFNNGATCTDSDLWSCTTGLCSAGVCNPSRNDGLCRTCPCVSKKCDTTTGNGHLSDGCVYSVGSFIFDQTGLNNACTPSKK